MERVNVKNLADRVRENIARVIIGKDEEITLLLTAVICRGSCGKRCTAPGRKPSAWCRAA